MLTENAERNGYRLKHICQSLNKKLSVGHA